MRFGDGSQYPQKVIFKLEIRSFIQYRRDKLLSVIYVWVVDRRIDKRNARYANAVSSPRSCPGCGPARKLELSNATKKPSPQANHEAANYTDDTQCVWETLRWLARGNVRPYTPPNQDGFEVTEADLRRHDGTRGSCNLRSVPVLVLDAIIPKNIKLWLALSDLENDGLIEFETLHEVVPVAFKLNDGRQLSYAYGIKEGKLHPCVYLEDEAPNYNFAFRIDLPLRDNPQCSGEIKHVRLTRSGWQLARRGLPADIKLYSSPAALTPQSKKLPPGITKQDMDRLQKILTMVDDQWGPLDYDSFNALDQDAIMGWVWMGVIEVRLHQKLSLPKSMLSLEVDVEGACFDIHKSVSPSPGMIEIWAPTIAKHYAGNNQWMKKIHCISDNPTEWRLTGRFLRCAEQARNNPTGRHSTKYVEILKPGRFCGRIKVCGQTPLKPADSESSKPTITPKQLGRKPEADQKEDKPVDLIPLKWLRDIVPQSVCKGKPDKLAQWLRNHGVPVFKIGHRNHASQSDLLKVPEIRRRRKVRDLIEQYFTDSD